MAITNRSRLRLFLALLGIAAAPGTLATAGVRPSTQPWTGSPGITFTVQRLMEMRKPSSGWAPTMRKPRLSADRRGIPVSPDSPLAAEWPTLRRPAGKNPGGYGPKAPQAPGLSFDGAVLSDTPGYLPPDPDGAAGPSQYLVAVNGLIRTFNKATGLKDNALDMNLDTFFASVTTQASLSKGVTDPHCRFDRLTNRWFVICIDLADVNNRVLVAVSSGPAITGTASFTFFYFQQNVVSPAGDTDYFADYPTLGIDINALYIGVNMFTLAGRFRGSTGFVVRKSSILGSGPIVVTAFRGMCTATDTQFYPGPYTPQGVDNDDPAATQGYFIGVDDAIFGQLTMRRVSNPGTTPTISADLPIAVPTTAYGPAGIPALGSTCPLDGADDRLFQAQINLNPATGTRTLWTAHTVGTDAAGVASDTPDRQSARWYEIQNLSTTPILRQSGTLCDTAAASPRSYLYPSMAMSGQGHVAMSCSTAGIAEQTGIALTGRLSTDPLGKLQAVTMAPITAASYNAQVCNTTTTSQRWGDFSVTTVDPNDNMTMWTIQEYANTINSWACRVIRLLAPPPATPATCVPGSIAPGATNVNIVVTGNSVNGSGFYDPGAGFPNHISAGVSDTGVTVNSVTYDSPTQVTLNVTVAANAPGGARIVTVTNPDGQAKASATAILTVAGTLFTSADVSTALKIAGGMQTASSAQDARYDIVGAGGVTIVDATQIMRKVMGLGTNP